jgi:uncharacterized protein with von Willebrand factor type A (vWA) domain
MAEYQFIVIVVLLLFAVSFFVYYFIFNIYELTYKVEIKRSTENTSIIIKSIPLNSFGKKAIFRNAPANFEIKEGRKLVEIQEENFGKGYFVIITKEKNGFVSIDASSEYALFPSVLRISF